MIIKKSWPTLMLHNIKNIFYFYILYNIINLRNTVRAYINTIKIFHHNRSARKAIVIRSFCSISICKDFFDSFKHFHSINYDETLPVSKKTYDTAVEFQSGKVYRYSKTFFLSRSSPIYTDSPPSDVYDWRRVEIARAEKKTSTSLFNETSPANPADSAIFHH